MLLFGRDLLPGFHHRDAFVTTEEESRLAGAISGIEFRTFEMRGVVAKRRVAFFGRSYDAARGPERPIPEFLFPLRERFAAWANVDPQAFAMALINEYRLARRSDGTATRRSTTSSRVSRYCRRPG